AGDVVGLAMVGSGFTGTQAVPYNPRGRRHVERSPIGGVAGHAVHGGNTMNAGVIRGFAGGLIWTEPARFPAMARFYRDTLGLTPRSDRSDFINFDWNGVRLSVSVHDRVHGESGDPLAMMGNL